MTDPIKKAKKIAINLFEKHYGDNSSKEYEIEMEELEEYWGFEFKKQSPAMPGHHAEVLVKKKDYSAKLLLGE